MKSLKPNYYMNELMYECISHYLDTFLLLQDTPDYLPPDSLSVFVSGISKELKRKWKSLRKFDKRYQKSIKPPSYIKQLFMKLSKSKCGKERSTLPDGPTPEEEPKQETLPKEVPNKEVQSHVEK